MRNADKILVGKLERNKHLRDFAVANRLAGSIKELHFFTN
jgi:hypothetical protein